MVDDIQENEDGSADVTPGKGVTRNFVIFPGNEHKLKILSRNGVPVNP
jgi:hypothetical protein